ncbi:serine protease 3 [Drosophila grimshawi]|uniref:trypsin n=1 Tax=Drosophila grimshawi TaxID=7222 RepID=B4IY96_DROGR|nr:serine protease 3 [Drosophila grimshawi]EDV96546.1 GH16313 [Drosophila grimshawi]
MKLLVVFIYLSVALVSGNETTESPEPENIIIGGSEGRAPYMVGLVLGTYGTTQTGLCGGAIISNNFVVTAAQCLTTDFVDIHYGSNTRRGLFTHRVTRGDYYVQPQWPLDRGYDIGLIRTPHLAFTYWVDMVNLPSSSYNRYDNQWAVACGWGEQANKQYAQTLQCVSMEIMGNDLCARYYGPLSEGTLCTRTPGAQSTCPGDNGGPLVTEQNPTLVGVTTFFSPGGCTAGHPAGFTNVAFHVNWIRSIIHQGVRYY